MKLPREAGWCGLARGSAVVKASRQIKKRQAGWRSHINRHGIRDVDCDELAGFTQDSHPGFDDGTGYLLPIR